MVSKDRKRRDKDRAASRKRRSDTATISSLDTVAEKRLNVETDDQNAICSDVFAMPASPENILHEIALSFDNKSSNAVFDQSDINKSFETSKVGRPRKLKGGSRKGSGRKATNHNPVAQASDDFESEVIQGLFRDLDITENVDEIDSSSQISVSTATLRRSTRHSSTISRFSDISFDDKWPSNRPITHNCYQSHSGLGCGAKNSKHMPKYYNSLFKNDVEIDCRCPFCKAILLPSETIGRTAFAKCCAKGRVRLDERFTALQEFPIGIDLMLHNPANSATRDRLLKNVLRYNDQLSFGQLRMERAFDFPDSYRIVKTNNMFNYMLFDFRQPGGQQQPELRGQLYTIPPHSSDIRLNDLATENELDPVILQELFNILKQNHWMAELFKIASDVYQDLSADLQLQFRMLVVDANKRGTERTIENVSPLDINPSDASVLHQIHPGRLSVETAAGSQLVAQFYLDNGENVPPDGKYDVILTGQKGTGQVSLKWWHRAADAACFPLLFPKGQNGFENNLKLILQPGEALQRSTRVIVGAEGDLDPEIDLGEGEEFLHDIGNHVEHHREHVSRAQYYRYMCQQRGTSWKAPHWLWEWGQLAQLYTITYNQRMEAQKVQYMKQLQGKYRYVRQSALLDWLKKLLEKQGI
uniref:Uncharacterized protein n=1 Tax=Meloidogyne enterolobii TaxID=390850 RepID=A0A6V7X163_MELEN|nr:unnamed protein product [Meloidogyne enterolobii]